MLYYYFNNMLANVALILGAYLLGSVPHLYFLGKLRGINLEGDLHIALWRQGGRVAGTAGILIDLAKGPIPVLVGKGLGFEPYIIAIAGLAVVAGQMWPVFFHFDGEKGNSTGLSMSAALTPVALLFALIPVVIGFAIRTVPRMLESTHSINERLKFGGPPSLSLPLGMAIAFALLPLLNWWLGQPLAVILVYLALFILIMLRRLTAGLKDDLKPGANVPGILLFRLLFDRSHR
jgi:glycerol-3-phosphate acyltransferase PlsY